MTIGRLLAIPLANKFKVQSQLRVLVWANVIITGFCLLMMITGNLIIIAYLGSALVGLAISAVYPLLMSIPGAFGY
jgi:MFS family permease